MASTAMVGPDPPAGADLYLSPRDILLYSPGAYLRKSWPWADYRRVPRPDQQIPTVMKSYGGAAIYAGTQGGAHGFFRLVPGTGYRFFSPAELAVAQGFPAGIALPSDNRAAWQLLGNAIPPPMALLGLHGTSCFAHRQGRPGEAGRRGLGKGCLRQAPWTRPGKLGGDRGWAAGV